MENLGKNDRYEKLQPPRPKVDENLIGTIIEQLRDFTKPDGTVVHQWCKGKVVTMKSNNKAHIERDESCGRDGDAKISEENLLINKWNKHLSELDKPLNGVINVNDLIISMLYMVFRVYITRE